MKKIKTIGVYPGSFNPFTIGHYNILLKAQCMFDEVIVAVGLNPLKKDTGTYTKNKEGDVYQDITAHRTSILSEQLNMTVQTYSGYLTEYLRSIENEHIVRNEPCRVILIRGLRNGDDLDYEINQIRVMEDLIKPRALHVAFINCDREYEHISSTVCRAMEVIEKNSSQRYIYRHDMPHFL